jgi:hypothetical protein
MHMEFFVIITYLEGNINIYGLLKGQDMEWKFVRNKQVIWVCRKSSTMTGSLYFK